MPQILLRHLLWKTFNFFMSLSKTFQQSKRYSSTDLTLLLWMCIFVCRLYYLEFQIGRSAPEAHCLSETRGDVFTKY